MKRTRCATWIVTGLLSLAAWANLPAEEGPERGLTVSASVNLLTHYMWRGECLSREFVTQQSVTLGYQGFACNLWSNVQFQPTSLSEVDLTFSYTRPLGPVKLEAGWTYYGAIDALRSNEAYAAGTFSTFLKPKIIVYVDLDAGKGAYLQGGVEHAFNLPKEAVLKVGASASLLVNNAYVGVNDRGEEFCAPFVAEITASITLPLGGGFELTPSVTYCVPLSENARQAIRAFSVDDQTHTVYGGLTLNYTH